MDEPEKVECRGEVGSSWGGPERDVWKGWTASEGGSQTELAVEPAVSGR